MTFTVKAKSLDWALAHALKFGDTDIFPVPFEFDAIQHSWGDIRSYLENQDVLAWSTRPHRYCLVPKARFGFRIATQLDPLDFLLFAALVYEIGEEIEARRVPTSGQIVFSYRFAPEDDGRMFDADIGFSTFLEHSRDLCETHEGFVAVTDISDFYPRLYHHPLQNALVVSSSNSQHVTSIMRLLAGWNQNVSYGLPVGNAPSRMLAEIAIADVDAALLGAGIQFIRYNDDYRIFTKTKAEGYRSVAFLAQMLHDNHGLNLQPNKTEILDVETFGNRYLHTHRDMEAAALDAQFHEFLDSMGVDSYEEVDPEQIGQDQMEMLESMNLEGMFQREIERAGGADLPLVKFILRRMAQIGSPNLVSELLDNIDNLYPILPDIVKYLVRVGDADPSVQESVGKELIKLVQSSIVSQLEFHRMWLLYPFAESAGWGNAKRFYQLLGNSDSAFARRKLILAMGRAHHEHWFHSARKRIHEEAPWPRRALIWAASCQAPDARRHWYRSIERQLDPLETAVVKYAIAEPFRQ